MNNSKAPSKGRSPLVVRTFPNADFDDLHRNLFASAIGSQGHDHLRLTVLRGNQYFEAACRAFVHITDTGKMVLRTPGASDGCEHCANTSPFLRADDELLFDYRDDCDFRFLIRRRGALISIVFCEKHRHVFISVAAQSAEAAETTLGETREAFGGGNKDDTKPGERRIKFGFWYMGAEEAERRQKELRVPTWAEVGENYSAITSNAIGSLVSGFEPGASGRLLLWHGKPGTGKTFAIRSLAWEWREWCDFECIMDPENLFGSRADYLAKIAIDGNEEDGADEAARWRVLVLEDTGELLAMDAKQQTGQGLSRLLNAVDGLLGQGSRVLLLITTNEELGALHPAVTRPGRCASQIEFSPLSPAEAKRWLLSHGNTRGDLAPRAPRTIAELYAMLEGRAVQERLPIGFAK